ncbi:MAG: cupin fold metalloprotein, WbuC family [Spirulina sp. SIO3F2]|nr:cupin fold metalloprotein, WbuC family [Spirulina sp. SIO3F2]
MKQHSVRLILLEKSSVILKRKNNELSWSFPSKLIEASDSSQQTIQKIVIELFGSVSCFPSENLHEECFSLQSGDSVEHFFCLPCIERYDLTRVIQKEFILKWFEIEEILDIDLSSTVYRNFSALVRLVWNGTANDFHMLDQIESRLLDINRLSKKNERVFYTTDKFIGISNQQIFLMKEFVRLRDLPVFRICFHTSDKACIQEMLIIHTRPTVIKPHKQEKESVSYHVVEGHISVEIHDDQGNVFEKYEICNHLSSLAISANNKQIFLRIPANQFRTLQSLSSFAIFFEISIGPFQDSDTVWMKDLSQGIALA